MKMANSITATRRIGSEMDLNTKIIMMATRRIDTELTVLKSQFVILIRSFVQGASPISIPSSS